MPTWREIRLFCKRHQLLMFCTYVAAIYIVLNVFVAENNVSLLRYQKSENSEFIDDLLGENGILELRERGITLSGRRRDNDKRNNFGDLRFKTNKPANEADVNLDDKGKDVKDIMNENQVNNLPINKFHDEDKIDDKDDKKDDKNDDKDDDESERLQLRGKLDRVKRLEEIIREEKKEFGAYWEKINKNKSKEKNSKEENKFSDEHEKDVNKSNDKTNEDDNDDKNNSKEKRNDSTSLEKELNKTKTEEDIISNETKDGKNKGDTKLEHHTTTPKPKIIDVVMAQLEKDKLDTFEVNLTALNKTEEDVKIPYFVEYGEIGDPGENSTKYEFPEDELSKEQKDKKAEDYTRNYFDLWVSNKISIHRTLYDARTEGCRKQEYGMTKYPTVSVIIVFHNEAWTTLLRSIHSIIDRTPKEALLEIVLLDDLSTDDHLKEPLEIYMKNLKIVRLIRGTQRLGLIKARNLGFLYSKGEIIIFLDSHIECFQGWLEPLIAPIDLNPRTVTFPIIDVIDKDNFGIQILPGNNVGTLNFVSMSFIWERSEEKDKWYYRSPTMPGGLYAISRKWFQHLGAYDPGLKLWGGENLEISFKIWMCGGTLLASACSHVGHIFRTKSPNHSHEMTKAIKANTFRLAEVWLDQYKHLYYEKFNYRVSPYGNVTTQRALRRSLNCKPFDWYLSEINPTLKKKLDVGGKYAGLVTNRGTGMCLQADVRLLTVRRCDMMHYGQVWQLSKKGFLSSHDSDMVVMEFASKHRNSNTTTTLYTVKMRNQNIPNREAKALFTYDEFCDVFERRLMRKKDHLILEEQTASTAVHHLSLSLLCLFTLSYLMFQDCRPFKSDHLQKSLHIVHKESKLCLDVEPSGSRAIRLSPCGANVPVQKWELMTRRALQAYHQDKNVPIDWSV